MDIELPTAPAGVVTIIALLAPYLIALVNHPRWTPGWKRLMSVAGSVILTVAGLVGYYAITREPVPDIPQLLLLGLVVSQASFALIAKPTAKRLERATSREL